MGGVWDSTRTWAELVNHTALAAERVYEARDAYTRLLTQTSWDSPAGERFAQRVESMRRTSEMLAQRIDAAHSAAVAASVRADAERSQWAGPGAAYGSRAGWG
ncbi:hypothetical protein [Zhihengliuella halotolerans]|uniref:hypothetical protein n=1 Tax=Zhihengliuella halotolerans TaxID=370736 RepID=UPI000C804FE9|nr:hypothetical protein [Zhihengliuella halotolerans]